jgi:hypothetical protein
MAVRQAARISQLTHPSSLNLKTASSATNGAKADASNPTPTTRVMGSTVRATTVTAATTDAAIRASANQKSHVRHTAASAAVLVFH